MALPWVPKRKSKDKRKGGIIGGKQTDLKQKHPSAVPGTHELRQNLSQGFPEQRQMQPWEDEPTRGAEQGLGRVGMGIGAGWGMQEAPSNPTQSLPLSRERAQGAEAMGAGRRVGSWCCTAIKDLWGGFTGCEERGEEF